MLGFKIDIPAIDTDVALGACTEGNLDGSLRSTAGISQIRPEERTHVAVAGQLKIVGLRMPQCPLLELTYVRACPQPYE